MVILSGDKIREEYYSLSIPLFYTIILYRPSILRKKFHICICIYFDLSKSTFPTPTENFPCCLLFELTAGPRNSMWEILMVSLGWEQSPLWILLWSLLFTKELVKMSSHIWPCGRAGGQLGQGVGMMKRAVWAVAWIKDIRRLRTKTKVEQKQEQTHPSPELSWPIHSTLSLSKAHCWLSASHNGHLLFSP